MISNSEFSRVFLGYSIIDCVIRRKNFFYFIAREDYTQWTDWEDVGPCPEENDLEKRVITFVREGSHTDIGFSTLTQFERITAGLSIKPKEQLVSGSIDGQVYVLGSGDSEIQEEIGDGLRGLFKLKTIGDELYFAGGGRSVARRKGKNQWEWLTHRLCDDFDEIDSAGFEDVDGFSPDDIYAVGGESDIWHYNGKAWRRIDFPTNSNSNTYTDTVCCAGDGRVYISGYEGLTFVGREDAWKKVELDEPLSLAFTDMLWHEDRVWCTNDDGVWWIVEDTIVEADIPAFARISAGHLSVRDGVLLVAGFHGAAFLENGEWHQIFSYGEMAELCKVEGKDNEVLQARRQEFKGG